MARTHFVAASHAASLEYDMDWQSRSMGAIQVEYKPQP
jgi:hypothetical protein